MKSRSGRVATVFYVNKRGVVNTIKLEVIYDKVWASDDDQCGA